MTIKSLVEMVGGTFEVQEGRLGGTSSSKPITGSLFNVGSWQLVVEVFLQCITTIHPLPALFNASTLWYTIGIIQQSHGHPFSPPPFLAHYSPDYPDNRLGRSCKYLDGFVELVCRQSFAECRHTSARLVCAAGSDKDIQVHLCVVSEQQAGIHESHPAAQLSKMDRRNGRKDFRRRSRSWSSCFARCNEVKELTFWQTIHFWIFPLHHHFLRNVSGKRTHYILRADAQVSDIDCGKADYVVLRQCRSDTAENAGNLEEGLQAGPDTT